MPEVVIDILEAVKVDEENRKQSTRAPRNSDGVVCALVQERAVRDARQGVVRGDELKALLVLTQCDLRSNGRAQLNIFLSKCLLHELALGNVGSHATKGRCLAVAVKQRKLVNDAGVQQAIAITRDFLDLDSRACCECLSVVCSELRCELSRKDF